VFVSIDEIKESFAAVIAPGDDVLVHASLGRIGRIAARVDDVVLALRSAVGSAGTLIMMTDTRSFARTGLFSMSMPSETGLLTECFRCHPDVVRSCVPMVSFAAVGPRSQEYTQRYNSHLDRTATITRLLHNDGKILLIGVGYDKCTLYHLAEERSKVPYNEYKTFSGHLIDKNGEVLEAISQRYFVRSDMTMKKSPEISGKALEAAGRVAVKGVGNGFMRSFKAREFDQICMAALQEDPYKFVISSNGSDT